MPKLVYNTKTVLELLKMYEDNNKDSTPTGVSLNLTSH